jgi:hypothetical protein
MFVSIDREDGRVMVAASERGLPVYMLREGGVWTPGVPYSAHDLRHNFHRASPVEAEELFQEAMAAYSSITRH